MGYNIKKQKESSTKEKWNKGQPDYITDFSAREIQSMGGSKRYGKGGRWISDNEYIAINGNKSNGGMPLKLMTKTGQIPISKTDADKLSDYIRRT